MNHRIRNLTRTQNGLFAATTNVLIKNLYFEDCLFDSIDSASFGCLIANASNTTIENVHLIVSNDSKKTVFQSTSSLVVGGNRK